MDRLTGPDLAAELLKLLRGRWMTRHAVARELGLQSSRASDWMLRLAAQGLLHSRRKAVQSGRPGLDVHEYTVADAWMGTAAGHPPRSGTPLEH